MARPRSSHPTDGELQILRVLWDRGPSSLSEVCEALRRDRDIAVTTVATNLNIMRDKKLVRRTGNVRSHQWSAVVTQSDTAQSMVSKLIDGVFDGSAQMLIAHVVEADKLSAAEAANIRKLLDTYVARKRKKNQ